MNGSLLRTLVSKNFFNKGIEVDAIYYGRDMSGVVPVPSLATFTVIGIRVLSADVAMEGASVKDGMRRLFLSGSIKAIAGMDPLRFAASCGLDPNGDKIYEGKRRGRKPKNWVPDVEDNLLDEDDEIEDDEIFD